jgi:hypothetical protein
MEGSSVCRTVMQCLGFLVPTIVCPWGGILPKLILLVKNSPAFYGTRRFITTFKTASCLFLFWTIGVQSAPSLPIYLRSILILSPHLRLDHPIEINYEYPVNRELGSLLGISTRLWAGWHSVRAPARARDPSLNRSDRRWVPPSLLFKE